MEGEAAVEAAPSGGDGIAYQSSAGHWVLAVAVLGSGGSAAWPLAVPSLAALAGTIVHTQAIVFDTAAGNSAGLVMSDAATLVVGP